MEGDDGGAFRIGETAHLSVASENLPVLLGSREEEDQFEQVSLKDQEKSVAELPEKGSPKRLSVSDAVSQLSAGTPDSSASRLSQSHDEFGSSFGSGRLGQIAKSVSSLSVDSTYSSQFGDVGTPINSPLKPRPRLMMPNVSPELVHLVEMCIHGDSGSFAKLKETIKDEESLVVGDDVVSISSLLVDVLFATMGGVEGFEDSGDRNPPSIMLNAKAAVLASELIPCLSCDGDSASYMSPRTKVVKGLFLVLKACTRNRTMCSNESLLGVLLSAAEKVFLQEQEEEQGQAWDASWLCNCLQLLAQHSLSVTELRRWLEVVSNTLNTCWASHLMLALEKAIGGRETKGPSCTFEFDGESSGLLGPGESRWPFSNGYAFATWLYIESFADTVNTAAAAAAIAAAAAAKSGKSSAMSAAAAASALAGEGTAHMPRLYSFLSADNQGVEAYFHGQFLVVESGIGKGKKASLHFTHAFKPQCWYFVGLEHTYRQSLLGKAESELRLYVDGALYESRPFEFPRISKPLAFCCIGTNPPPTMAGLQRRRRQCPLFAEMGPIYIFKEPIGPERMARLSSRGGDVLPSFGNSAGSPWLATNECAKILSEESYLLDAEIGPKLHLLYHPRLLNGRYCPDASPSGATGTYKRPAEVLGQVHVASRTRPLESLWAMAEGGPMCLFPLVVSNVQPDTLEPKCGSLDLSIATVSLSAPILRILSISIQHPGINEELRRAHGPEVLAILLRFLLQSLSCLDVSHHSGVKDEEVVAAVVFLCQSQKSNSALKVQWFSNLLLDLKMWSLCSYGLQKKLLSSLADMVFTESSAMRDANAVQMLLDGCRRCYWVVREPDSIDTFSLTEAPRPVGEINALVDELLVIIELLVGTSAPSKVADDVRCLIGFLVDSPQTNQVARVLHLFYRLIVQPNATRAHTFATSFISCGGIEILLVLLQREAKTGDYVKSSKLNSSDKETLVLESVLEDTNCQNELQDDQPHAEEVASAIHDEPNFKSFDSGRFPIIVSADPKFERMTSVSESLSSRTLGGISFSISADSARKNVYNVDNDDGIVVGIISLLGALVTSGHIKFLARSSSSVVPNNTLGSDFPDEGTHMFADKVSLLLFALQKAFQAAPQRLMTANVYINLLGVTINASSSDDGLNLYDSGHRFEHVQLLLVLLRSLPFASRAFQARAIQDLLFLACSHPENRSCLTCMEEWPEWILEVLISNYELGSNKHSDGINITDIEDLVHNFLIIMLEHSMRQKDGWKDVESTLHCAEWLSMVGGSSTGDQRIRREESLPIFKRRLLGGLLDFASRELQVQTQVIAAAAAGVASEGLSPEVAKAEAEFAAQLSVALAENAIVILMLVEDHLRLQSQLFNTSRSVDSLSTSASVGLSSGNRSNSVGTTTGDSSEASLSHRQSLSGDTGGLSLDVLASMADSNGQISAAIMERLTAATAAEPYESVRCAFVSYGSCAVDLAEGWKYRSRLWYGVGHPSKSATFGGGGNGWESWMSALEKDPNGSWIELPLVKKSITMLQALLLDESGLGGGLDIGGGSGTGMGGMAALYQLLDSDQPFLSMLRMVLVSLREEDNGEDGILVRSTINQDEVSATSYWQGGHGTPLETLSCLPSRKPRSALLWSVLSPVLNMPISESKRQRVLVSSSILYSEVYHAVSREKQPLRKQYLEAILPPFVAILRRWRPLLAGIHELTSSDGVNPLIVDDRALAADALPVEASLAMISPGWAAAFASPPAAMALAMIAAGAAGTETAPPARNNQLRRDSSLLERKTTRLHTFASFQKPLEGASKSPVIPRDKAAAKAAALAASRDLERNAKIGSGRGLSAVAMATSAQRRSAGDMDRVRRWNISDAMGTAWTECLQSYDTKGVSGKDYFALSYKYVAVLVAAITLARNVQRIEIDRRAQVSLIDGHHASVGSRAWRRLIHCLIEINALFGPLRTSLCSSKVLWKLDFMESSSRMRRCLRRNYKGSIHAGAAANYEEHILSKADEEPSSHGNDAEVSVSGVFSSNSPIIMPEALLLEGGDEDDDKEEVDDVEDRKSAGAEIGINKKVFSATAEQPLQYENQDVAEVSQTQPRQSTSGSISGNVFSEVDEKLVREFPSSMVCPLRVVKGTFQITTKRINFILDQLAAQISTGNEVTSKVDNNQEKDWSWLISSLHQVFSRRYLLRRSALELFMLDQSNFFFDFGTAEGRRNAYRAIVQARPPHLSNIYLATQRPEQLLKRTQLMERWARWEISNFEYLMQLNTLAGRTYNDITQYPVFPWILANYNSESLDLDDPSSYRDLSKPIGALNAERLEKFLERYSTFDDPIIPKFHYGSHYSSAGTVLYYLVRVEPFTTLAIQLQGGKFDHADRMFSDIGATWSGVLEDMSDVKELVPELFYLPEALTNENQIEFGTTQLGGKIDTVKLPPWAKSPVDFIQKHQKALESEYVSTHLHEWIDLIFGYKQRGKEAIEANNVFFYITYEGAVDIDKISDPVLRQAAQDQIAYFGQTPSQLLTTPHLRKRPLDEALHLQTIFRNPTELRQYVIPNPERCNVPAAAVCASTDSIIIVDSNVPAAHVALHKWQPNTPDGHGMPFLFQHGKCINSSTGGTFMRMFKGQPGSCSDEWQFPQASAFPTSGIRSNAVVAITSNNDVITGGHADNSLKLISSDGAKTIETASGHCAPVTCIAISPTGDYLVSGSRDATLILWRLHFTSASPASQNSESSTTTAPSSPLSSSGATTENKRRRFIEGPAHIFRGHLNEVICCCVNSDIGIAVSCSQNPGVLLHSIRRGRLLRQLDVSVAHAVCLSSGGVIVTWSKSNQKLCTFTVNGIHIATATLSPWLGDISCMEISADGESLLVGVSSCDEHAEKENTTLHLTEVEASKSERCSFYLQVADVGAYKYKVPVPCICFLDLHTLKVFHSIELKEGESITAMALNKDNTNLVVSTEDKQLMIFTDPTLSLKVVDQMLRLGWEGDGLSPLIK